MIIESSMAANLGYTPIGDTFEVSDKELIAKLNDFADSSNIFISGMAQLYLAKVENSNGPEAQSVPQIIDVNPSDSQVVVEDVSDWNRHALAVVDYAERQGMVGPVVDPDSSGTSYGFIDTTGGFRTMTSVNYDYEAEKYHLALAKDEASTEVYAAYIVNTWGGNRFIIDPTTKITTSEDIQPLIDKARQLEVGTDFDNAPAYQVKIEDGKAQNFKIATQPGMSYHIFFHADDKYGDTPTGLSHTQMLVHTVYENNEVGVRHNNAPPVYFNMAYGSYIRVNTPPDGEKAISRLQHKGGPLLITVNSAEKRRNGTGIIQIVAVPSNHEGGDYHDLLPVAKGKRPAIDDDGNDTSEWIPVPNSETAIKLY